MAVAADGVMVPEMVWAVTVEPVAVVAGLITFKQVAAEVVWGAAEEVVFRPVVVVLVGKALSLWNGREK